MAEKGFMEKMKSIGPAAILAACSMGPGTVASCMLGGSVEGYNLLWLVALSGFLCAVVSLAGGRVYAVTGKTGYDLILGTMGKWITYPVFIWMALAGFFVLASEGKLMAHTTAMMFPNISPTVNDWVLLPVLVVAAAVIFSFGFKRVVQLCSIMVAVMAALFLANIFLVHIDPVGFAEGLIPALPTDKTGMLALGGIMGGSASGIVAIGYSYLVRNKGWNGVEFIGRMTRDQIVFSGIAFGVFSVGVYVTAAAVLHPQGIAVNSAIDAAQSLEPLVGSLSKWLFLLGLFGAIFTTLGALATVQGYFIADMLGIPADLNNKKFRTLIFCSILVGMLGPWLSGLPAMRYIVFAMVIFLLIGPAVLAFYLYIGNKAGVMGEHKYSWFINIVLVIAFILNCIGSAAVFMK